MTSVANDQSTDGHQVLYPYWNSTIRRMSFDDKDAIRKQQMQMDNKQTDQFLQTLKAKSEYLKEWGQIMQMRVWVICTFVFLFFPNGWVGVTLL